MHDANPIDGTDGTKTFGSTPMAVMAVWRPVAALPTWLGQIVVDHAVVRRKQLRASELPEIRVPFKSC